jgi:transposase
MALTRSPTGDARLEKYLDFIAHRALPVLFLQYLKYKDMGKKLSKEETESEVLHLVSNRKITKVEELERYKLSECHPCSAGIDLGSRGLYVALNPEIAAELDLPVVRRFNTFTKDLLQCRDLLLSCGIKTVAMESTSVYWTTIYFILEKAGIEVCPVNPKKFRMVPGRKTDVADSQWLQTLHLYGLLRGSFHPSPLISELRTYMRERDSIIKERSTYVQRMQKAMVKMNLLLHNVIDDITGKTGVQIITSILDGERDPKRLAAFRDPHCKKSEEEIIEALTGYYKEDQLYLLKSNYKSYCFFDGQISDLDRQIAKLLKKLPCKKKKKEERPDNGKGRSKGKNDIRTADNLEDTLFHILGADLSSLPGIRANAILQIISEVGTDMSKFPTAHHFASYLGFVPHNKITGDRVISSRTDRIKSSAAQAFRKLIPAISLTKTALGAFYRRLASRTGKAQAIVATCRKLAILFYNTLAFGRSYVEQGEMRYKQKQEAWERKKLEILAKKYNYNIVAIETIVPD